MENKPVVELSGHDGNVFNIIGRVIKILKRAGLDDNAKNFSRRALNAQSYDEVLQLAMEYCEVE